MDIDLIPDDAKIGDAKTADVKNGDATTADVKDGDATNADVKNGDATTVDVKDDPKSDDAKTTDGNKEAAKLLETVALWLTQYIQVINFKNMYFTVFTISSFFELLFIIFWTVAQFVIPNYNFLFNRFHRAPSAVTSTISSPSSASLLETKLIRYMTHPVR
jgi:hypothetical protein